MNFWRDLFSRCCESAVTGALLLALIAIWLSPREHSCAPANSDSEGR